MYMSMSPLGVLNILRFRSLWAVPGVAGVLTAYSFYPRPTQPMEGYQNTAGAPRSAQAALTGL